MDRAQVKPLLDSNKNNCPHNVWEGQDLVNQIEWEYADIKSKRDAQRVIIVNKQDPANFKYF